jgi:nitrate/TMAO reductase-like tetraheme cytochrome c subunit
MLGILRPVRALLRPLFRVGRFWARHPLFLTAGVAIVAAGFTFSSMEALAWMETEDFCSRCHTMTPQVDAHVVSKHSKVDCAECHVGPGLSGLVKAKVGGMRQTVQLILGDYARPIPPAAETMPSANSTCGRCHDVASERGDLLLVRSHYSDDQDNTEQRVALKMKLQGDPTQPSTTGIHWHVLSKVEYISRDAQASVIDWVGVERPDGSRAEFISANAVQVSAQASVSAAELRSEVPARQMSCYDCHNRVGHEFSEPGQALDQAIASKRIDKEIPFIKKRGLEVISASYGSAADATTAIRGLEEWYHTNYPELWMEKPAALSRAFATLAEVYRTSSHPEMKASPAVYPNNLGHSTSNGCFRCHDGGHYLVKDGALTTEPIPSQCSLCHTFPTTGKQAPDLALGPAPAPHANKLWVFKHAAAIKTTDPIGTSCAECHSRSYCTNCHSSGAIAVKHDDMLFNHAQVVEKNTSQSCNYCHQKPFCERCHAAGTH